MGLENFLPTLVSVMMAQRAEFQARAFVAELLQKSRRNPDRIAAIAQFD